jgi:hypothetical protein
MYPVQVNKKLVIRFFWLRFSVVSVLSWTRSPTLCCGWVFRVRWAGQQRARPVRSRTAYWLRASSRRQLSRQKDSQSKFHLTKPQFTHYTDTVVLMVFSPYFCQAQLNLFSLAAYTRRLVLFLIYHMENCWYNIYRFRSVLLPSQIILSDFSCPLAIRIKSQF